MSQSMKLLDVVALLEAVPEKKLARGEVGTVVENLAPGVVEVEFSDDAGCAYASAALHENQLMLLRYRTARTA